MAKNSNVIPLHPKERTRTIAKRSDGWVNNILGYNTSRDPRTAHGVVSTWLSQEEAEEMWEGDDVSARAIEAHPNEMTRRGFDLQIQGEDFAASDPRESEERSRSKTMDKAEAPTFAPARVQPKPPPEPTPEEEMTDEAKEISEELMGMWEDLEADDNYREAMEYARAFGGGGIFIGVDDGVADLSKPIREDRIREVRFLTPLTPRELYPNSWYSNPNDKAWGRPALYRMDQDPEGGISTRRSFNVHESRIIRFDGIRTTRRNISLNRGWGGSALGRIQDVIRDFDMAWQGASLTLRDFGVGAVKFKNLAELLAAGEDGDKSLTYRLQQMELVKSQLRAMLLDESETYEKVNTSLAGLPDMMDKFCLRLAAAVSIPVTMLMGQAPAGLNATGESDIRWFYDYCASLQQRMLRRRQNRLMRLLMLAKKGPTGGREPMKWTIAYRPLWEMTDAQKAELRSKQATTDKLYIDAGVLTPEEVAISRFGGDEWSMETQIDVGARKVNAAAAIEAQQLQNDPEYQAQQKQKEIEAAAKANGEGGGTPPFGGK